MIWVGHIERMGGMSDAYKILAENSEWKTCGLYTDTVPPQPQEHKMVLRYLPRRKCILITHSKPSQKCLDLIV